MKDIGEKNEKIFTKVKCNNIIRNKYNPLNKDKCFYERKGFFMEETKDVVLKEVKKEISKKQMRTVLENICRYFNKDIILIEKYNNKK